MKAPRINLYSFCATTLLVALVFTTSPVTQAEEHFSAAYKQRNLVSDGFDPNLVNAWGVAFNPTGPVWVANNGTGTSTLYDGAGNLLPLVVDIPSIGSDKGGNPTGIVFNGTTDFVVSNNRASGASRFIFATEDGLIAGWAPNLDVPVSKQAVVAVDNSATGAVYKGLAIIAGGSSSMLYAADFHNNRIDVFDKSFTKKVLPSAFTDPMLPSGYAPFGLQAINGEIYVAYAKQNSDPSIHDEVQGPGFGYVDVFDPNGRFIHRAASAGKLNAPWGMALAPAGFGRFSGRLLVGNFGDGRINAYDVATGHYVGHLEDASDKSIKIEGLWGIAFGNGFAGQPVNTLFFAAGPGDEKHGLYGRIDVDMPAHGEHHDDRHAKGDD